MYLNTFLFFLLCNFWCDALNSELEFSKLKYEIFKSYDKKESPVDDSTKLSVKVYLVLSEVQLDSFSEKLSFRGFLAMMWNDTRLRWNPEEHGNITRIITSIKKIWKPTPAIIRNIMSTQVITYSLSSDNFQSYALCKSEGYIYALAKVNVNGLHNNFCSYDARYWPVDQRNCTLRIAFPSYLKQNISISPTLYGEYLYTNINLKTTAWELVDSANSKVQNPETNSDEIIITFHLKKHSSHYTTCVVTPAFVVLAIVMVLFWMDPRCPERVILVGMSIFCLVENCLTAAVLTPKIGNETPYVVRLTSLSLLLAMLHIIILIISRRLLVTSFNPPWLTTVTTWSITSSIFNRMFFLKFNQKMVAELIDEDEEESLLIMKSKKLQKQWQIIVRLIDFISFSLLAPISIALFAVVYMYL